MPCARPCRPALLVLAALTSGVAQTSPATVTFEPLTVTAQHRDQIVTEVPISLTAWSGNFLESHGITRYEDLAPLVPGFFASVQSANVPSLNVRGVNIDSTDPREESRVSVFQDGVSISRATLSVVELFDLERVEVLKGPQSTLFGRSAEAGALSIHSRRPEPGTAARLSLGAGTHGARTASGFLNAALVSDRLLGRVAFTSSRHDGTVASISDGTRLNGRDTVAVRPSLRWLAPGGDTVVDLILNWQRDTPPGTGFKSAVIPNARGDTDPFTAADLSPDAYSGLDRTVWGATAILSHTLSPAWSLHAVSGWREHDVHGKFDGDGSTLVLLNGADTTRGRQFSQELRLNYDAGGRLAGSLGGSWFHERVRQSIAVHIDERAMWPFVSAGFRDGLIAAGAPPTLALFAVPVMDPFQPQFTLPAGFAAFAGVPPLAALAPLAGAPLKGRHGDTYTTSVHIEALDLFADGTWQITDRLELTAGARLTFERQTGGYEAPASPVPSTLGFVFGYAPNFSTAATPGEITDTDEAAGWTGRLAARWTLTPETSAYASVSRGRRPAAIVITSSDRFLAQEETMLNTELGLKGRALDRRLLWSAAVFHYRYRHFQTTVQDPTNAARFLTIDAGRATGRGAELTLEARVRPTLHLFATYGFTDATFDHTSEDGAPQRFAGSSFRLTARHTAALGATWSRESARAGRFSLSPVWQYRSGHYFNDDNTLAGGTLRQPGFPLVNVRATWTARDRKWEVTAFATNLLDRKYLIDAGNIGASFGIPTFVRGSPRLAGVELARQW